MGTPAANKESSIDIAVGESLPGVCIVCGTPTTGIVTITYERPSSFLESFLRIAGALLIRRLPEENRQAYVLKLPVCDVHSYVDPNCEHLRIFPHRARSVMVSPVASEFAAALLSARETRAKQLADKFGDCQSSDPSEFFRSLGEK